MSEDDFDNSLDEDNNHEKLTEKSDIFVSKKMNQVKDIDNSEMSFKIKINLKPESCSKKKKKQTCGTKHSSILRNNTSTTNKTSNLSFDEILQQNKSYVRYF